MVLIFFCDDGDRDGGYMILMAGATTMTRKKTLAVHLEIGENISFSFVQLRKPQSCEFQFQFHTFLSVTLNCKSYLSF